MYHLLVVPRMTTLCTSTLSDLGVLGSIDVQEFQLGLIPLEKDLLSLEYEDVYRKLFLVSCESAGGEGRELTYRRGRMVIMRPCMTWAKR